MLYSSVAVDSKRKKVTINLPVSKTDPGALACERSWGCVCVDDEKVDATACPYHAAVAQQALLKAKFGNKVETEGFPFSPNLHGEGVSKEAMARAIILVALALGLVIVKASGKQKYTGHIFRIGGARHLARAAVQLMLIMILARWDSHVILRYVRDAPLSGLTDEYKKGKSTSISSSSSHSAPPAIEDDRKSGNKFAVKAMNQLKEMAEEVKKVQAELDDAKKHIEVVESAVHPIYVVSDKYQKWHITFPYADVQKKSWKCRCGWKYGKSVFDRMVNLPDDLSVTDKCKDCFEIQHSGEPESE